MVALSSTTMMMTRFSDGRWLVWLRCEHLFVNGFETGYAVNPMAKSNQCMVTGQFHGGYDGSRIAAEHKYCSCG